MNKRQLAAALPKITNWDLVVIAYLGSALRHGVLFFVADCC